MNTDPMPVLFIILAVVVAAHLIWHDRGHRP
jgi:hypothetical protein